MMLRLFTGPMFASKTTRLLEAVKHAQKSNKFERIIVAKWTQDVRSGSRNSIQTHDGKVFSNRSIVKSVDNLDVIDVEKSERVAIAVDEAQFFGLDLLRLWERMKVNEQNLMIVAGLDLDFKRKRFGHVLDLLENAQGDENVEINKLVSRCYVCGNDAPFSMRLVPTASQVLVGGSDKYLPACGEHHKIMEQEEEELQALI